MTILADYRTRIFLLLGDPTVSRFTNNQVDEGLRLAQQEYSNSYPQLLSSIITVSAAGREQPLPSMSSIRSVMRVQYPYIDETSLVYKETYFYYLAGSAILYFTGLATPRVGEKFRVHYSSNHTISGLDSAAVTTVPPAHDALMVEGAAGFTSLIRSAQLSESFANSNDQLMAQAQYYLANFRNSLLALKLETAFYFPLSGFPVDMD